ncbi:MAG: anti-sigma F factor antagonist [Firmicutes bacterium]|nr:anti-sigma F factor antagonist [Bacillota bacterium]
MDVELERVGDNLVARLRGELDLAAAPEFRGQVSRELENPSVRNLVLVLGSVSFVDSSGLGAILGRYKQVSQRGGRVVLVGMQPQVRKVFELAGLFKIVEETCSEDEALRKVAS